VIDPPLLLVTDRKQAAAPLADILEAAFAAGCRWASLREKDLSGQEQVALARGLLPLARKWNARLTVHGGADIAVAAGADGVHLAAGGDVTGARAVLRPGALVGISIHSVAEARSLDPNFVDYAIAGPVFETASKPGYGPALGAEGIRAIANAARVPVIAIGGITPERVVEIVAAGAAGIAVMGSVMRARDPGEEVRALLSVLAHPRARYGGTP
jgi:thiamine-phosphate pyrophosphorylase